MEAEVMCMYCGKPPEGPWKPAYEAKEYNPEHWDLKWNADFTAFIPRKLRWTDDASYARYQGDSE
jgi:hypothetical protein